MGCLGAVWASRRGRSLPGALCLGFWLVGCATTSPLPVAGPDLAPDEPPATYVVQRGDQLEIRVLNLPELEQQVLVRADGRISASLLDDVEAAGLTTEALAARLAAGWEPFFVQPHVTVIVRKFATNIVYVGGEVDAPGVVPLRNRMTSIKAVFFAGGLLNTAQVTNLILLRDAGGTPDVMVINLERVLEGLDPDIVLRPYDVLFVPKSRIARVNVWVEQYVKRVIPIDLRGAIQWNFISGAY
jgi:polysaccharide export outer membrane protein